MKDVKETKNVIIGKETDMEDKKLPKIQWSNVLNFKTTVAAASSRGMALCSLLSSPPPLEMVMDKQRQTTRYQKVPQTP
jgi:hypothetical protein